jgi:hypothetical protein
MVSLPVDRPVGRALIVGSPDCRVESLQLLQRLGFECAEANDPYAAMAEICRRPMVYRTVILSLQNLYREEIQVVGAIKSRFQHMEVWLVDIDGRQAALAEGLRLGADGLAGHDGLHRLGAAPAGAALAAGRDPGHPVEAPESSPEPIEAGPPAMEDPAGGPSGPLLTAEELRALLQD